MSNRDRNENFLSRAKLLTSGTMEEYFKFSSDIIERFLLEKEMRDLIAEYDENISTTDILYGRGAKRCNHETLQKSAKMYILQNSRDSGLLPDDNLLSDSYDSHNNKRRSRNKENDIKFKTRCKIQKHEYAIDDIDGHIGVKSSVNKSFSNYRASKEFKFRLDDEYSTLSESRKVELQSFREEPNKENGKITEIPAKEEYRDSTFSKSLESEEALGDERILNMTFFTDELKSQNIVQETTDDIIPSIEYSNDQITTHHTPAVDVQSSSICSACAILKQLDEYEKSHYITKNRAHELTELRKLIFQSVDHKTGCKKMRKDMFNKKNENESNNEIASVSYSELCSKDPPLKWALDTLKRVGYERAVEFITLTYEEKLRKFKNWVPAFMKDSKIKRKQKSGGRRCKARNRGILRRYPRCDNLYDNWKLEGLQGPFYFCSYDNTSPGIGMISETAHEPPFWDSRNQLPMKDNLFSSDHRVLNFTGDQNCNLFPDIRINEEANEGEAVGESLSIGVKNFSKFPESLDLPLTNLYQNSFQKSPIFANQQIQWDSHILSCLPPMTPTAEMLVEGYEDEPELFNVEKKNTVAGPSFKYPWAPFEAKDNNSFFDDDLPFSYPPPPSPEEPELNEYDPEQTSKIVNLFNDMEAEVHSEVDSCYDSDGNKVSPVIDWPTNGDYESPEECENYSIVTTPDPSTDEDDSDSDSDESTDSLDTVITNSESRHDIETEWTQPQLNDDEAPRKEDDNQTELARSVARDIINSLENEMYTAIEKGEEIGNGDPKTGQV